MNGDKIIQMDANTAHESAERLTFSSVFSLKDLKANNFGNLLVCDNEDEAIRACKIRLLYERDSLLQQFPADYMLYHVAYFNTKTGVMESTGVPIPIKSLLDINLELEHEKARRPVDVPDFMKGEETNVNRSEESSTAECVENLG